MKHLTNMPRCYAESLFQFTCVKILEIRKSNHFAMMMLDPFSQRKTDKCGGAVEEKKEYSSPVNIQSIKMKCVHNNCVQTCDIYALILSICNQSESDINLSINCYLKSIPIDNHRNLGHRLSISIGID